MPETLSWSASSTTPAEIEAALRDLLIRCHDQAGACTPARVLNLICVVDRAMSGAILQRLTQAGRFHASRTILCAVEPGRGTIGAVSNPDHMNISIGKAGRTRWLGWRPHNRGVVMNPIDHPHGGGEGRTSGGRHPVTPWGKPTKGKKTRSNKSTNRFILLSRHKRKK